MKKLNIEAIFFKGNILSEMESIERVILGIGYVGVPRTTEFFETFDGLLSEQRCLASPAAPPL